MYTILERLFFYFERKRLKKLFSDGVPRELIIYDAENEERPYQCKRCGALFGYWHWVPHVLLPHLGHFNPIETKHVCEDLR